MKATQDGGGVRPCERFDCRTQRAQIEILRAEVKDLRARLKAARAYLSEQCFLHPPCDLCRCKAQVLKRMNNLRRSR